MKGMSFHCLNSPQVHWHLEVQDTNKTQTISFSSVVCPSNRSSSTYFPCNYTFLEDSYFIRGNWFHNMGYRTLLKEEVRQCWECLLVFKYRSFSEVGKWNIYPTQNSSSSSAENLKLFSWLTSSKWCFLGCLYHNCNELQIIYTLISISVKMGGNYREIQNGNGKLRWCTYMLLLCVPASRRQC